MTNRSSNTPKLTADRTGTTSRAYGNAVRRKAGLPRGLQMHIRVSPSAVARLPAATWEEIDNGEGHIYWEVRRPGHKCVVYPTWRAARDAATSNSPTPPVERYETRLVPTAAAVPAVVNQHAVGLTLIQMGVAMLQAGDPR